VPPIYENEELHHYLYCVIHNHKAAKQVEKTGLEITSGDQARAQVDGIGPKWAQVIDSFFAEKKAFGNVEGAVAKAAAEDRAEDRAREKAKLNEMVQEYERQSGTVAGPQPARLSAREEENMLDNDGMGVLGDGSEA